VIEPLLPNEPRGVPRANDRRVLNGIIRRFRTGSPWRYIPERYGPSTTCYNRFVRWREARVWDRILDAASVFRWGIRLEPYLQRQWSEVQRFELMIA
jgi:transposase